MMSVMLLFGIVDSTSTGNDNGGCFVWLSAGGCRFNVLMKVS